MYRKKSEILQPLVCPLCGNPAESNSNRAGVRFCNNCGVSVQLKSGIQLQYICPKCKEPQLNIPVIQIGSLSKGIQFFAQCADCQTEFKTQFRTNLSAETARKFIFEGEETGGFIEIKSD